MVPSAGLQLACLCDCLCPALYGIDGPCQRRCGRQSWKETKPLTGQIVGMAGRTSFSAQCLQKVLLPDFLELGRFPKGWSGNPAFCAWQVPDDGAEDRFWKNHRAVFHFRRFFSMFIIVRSLESNFCTRSKSWLKMVMRSARDSAWRLLSSRDFLASASSSPVWREVIQLSQSQIFMPTRPIKEQKEKQKSQNRKKRTLLLPLLPL